MKIDYNKIKAGDMVRIANGDWFEVLHPHGDGMCIKVKGHPDGGAMFLPQTPLITGHKPAEAKTEAEGLTNPTPAHAPQPVGEWFTLDMMSELCDSKYGHGKMLVNLVKGDFDRVLTKHYGHPPAPKGGSDE